MVAATERYNYTVEFQWEYNSTFLLLVLFISLTYLFIFFLDEQISPSQFEAHAGMAARRQPWVVLYVMWFLVRVFSQSFKLKVCMSLCSYRHIYTSNGLTLHDIAMSLAHGQSHSTGGSDDMCTICGDGGNLLLCYCCPRAFHPGWLFCAWSSNFFPVLPITAYRSINMLFPLIDGKCYLFQFFSVNHGNSFQQLF